MFELIGKDNSSKARRGRLTTDHGMIDTPAFMPVGTQGSPKAEIAANRRFLVRGSVLGQLVGSLSSCRLISAFEFLQYFRCARQVRKLSNSGDQVVYCVDF